ncbi:phosphotransferase [Paenibacillus sp. MWE-103]|uniref:Phosphotransferase n=1 Tax=Paenibacillus artemisiicola TaxID=1172618 RepID=A0ABS3WC63_9BACL|nr:phosphotransferase [Paenibacillus artemisiicola]MBO7745705.1 phosphotransferase [Paenibacillus artemisiicola]
MSRQGEAMSDNRYHLQIAKLCKRLGLGPLAENPAELSGGLLHRMFALTTASGNYAVKALNPGVMSRPSAMANFLRSERIAARMAARIPALAAKSFGGSVLHDVQGQWYMVFDRVEGRAYSPSEIDEGHCARIGGILAEIHRMDVSGFDLPGEQAPVEPPAPADWLGLLAKGLDGGCAWAPRLQELAERLYAWEALANRSAAALASEAVVSHRDLDPKNVMWHQGRPVLIDWEAAGLIHPLLDTAETALYWAEDAAGSIDRDKLGAFLSGYAGGGGLPRHAEWRPVLEHGFLGKLDWLAYNLERSVGIGTAAADERRIGTEQAVATLEAVVRHAERIDALAQWLEAFGSEQDGPDAKTIV